MARRRYTREFKLEAVRLVDEQGLTIADAARDLDINKLYLSQFKFNLSYWSTAVYFQ